MPTTLKAVVNVLLGIINPLILLLAGLSLLYFFKGLASLIFKAGDEKAIEEGKDVMKWGLIALFVLVSLWGILGFLSQSFGFGATLVLPTLGVVPL